ncbi:hypothetical protein ACWGLF_46745 [Streptomyces puniciscabiei]
MHDHRKDGWHACRAVTRKPVSLLIATLAFHGTRLDEAKLGILATLVCSFLTARIVTAAIGLLPPALRLRCAVPGRW